MVLRKSYYIRWSAGRSPRVHEVNPGRDPSFMVHHEFIIIFRNYFSIKWKFRKIYPVRSNSEQL